MNANYYTVYIHLTEPHPPSRLIVVGVVYRITTQITIDLRLERLGGAI